MSVILQKVFTETSLEDVDLSKTQPFKYFVYMDRGNQSQEWRGITQTAIKCDTFWLQSFGTRHSCLANTKIICYRAVFALFYHFIFEGNFQVLAPGGLNSKGRFNGGFFALRVWGLISGGTFFRNFTVSHKQALHFEWLVKPATRESANTFACDLHDISQKESFACGLNLARTN